MPELEKVRGELAPQGVGFLAICLEEDMGTVRQWAERFHIKMPVASARSEMLGPFGITSVPSTLFLDASGTVVLAARGPRSTSYLRAHAAELLQKGAAPQKP